MRLFDTATCTLWPQTFRFGVEVDGRILGLKGEKLLMKNFEGKKFVRQEGDTH